MQAKPAQTYREKLGFGHKNDNDVGGFCLWGVANGTALAGELSEKMGGSGGQKKSACARPI